MARRPPSIFSNLLDTVTALGMMLLFIAAVFTIGMMPQLGLAYFVKLGGGPMFLPLIALIAAGRLWRGVNGRFALFVIIVTIVLMANLRGIYFHPFPTGRGFFSANRVLSNAMFALAFLGAAKWEAGIDWLASLKRK